MFAYARSLILVPMIFLGMAGTRADEGAQPPVPDDVAPPPRNPLIRSFRDLLENAPGFEGEDGELGRSLDEADELLEEAKEDNEEAIRQANRQVRVFGGSHSPSIILIAVENLAPGDLSCYGQQRYQTPAIDAIARAGVRFTDYYASSTIDPVAWWSLWTGYGTAGPPENWKVTDDLLLLPEMMWWANYDTALLGRLLVGGLNDIGGPRDNGFESTLGFQRLESPWELYPEIIYANGRRVRIPGNAGDENDWQTHEILAREAVLYMKRHCKGRPFFMTLSLEVSDRPNDPRADDIELWKDWTPRQRSHAGSVQRLDQLVEVLLQYLRDPEAPRNVVIVLTGVDGVLPDAPDENLNEFFNRTGPFQLSDDGLGEGNLRVPLIIYAGKKGEAGLVSDQVAGTWDLLPTLAALIRAIKVPKRIDGGSILPALWDNPLPPPVAGDGHYARPLVFRTAAGQRAVRVGPWKAVQPSLTGPWKLYNVETDPGETQDIAAAHAKLIERISDALEAAGP